MKKMNWLSFSIVACSILLPVLAFWKQRLEDQEKIASQKQQIQHKDEIISELKSFVTGGDGYIYIRPVKVANTPELLFVPVFDGKYPLYDVTIAVHESDMVQVERNRIQYRRAGDRKYDLGTVQPLKLDTLFQGTVPADAQWGKKYLIKITTRNGLTEEEIYVRQEGTHFSTAFKVVTFTPDYSTDGLIGARIRDIRRRKRHIDTAFPVGELDHLQGDSGWLADYEVSSGPRITLPAQQTPAAPAPAPTGQGA